MHYIIRETQLKSGKVRLEVFKEVERHEFADIREADEALSTLVQTLKQDNDVDVEACEVID